ncbi:MAG: hypothetical protein JEZ03_00315 [Bacteroidales bacterium]|nr:hypothetical protein [Bacteroidales bacterium]
MGIRNKRGLVFSIIIIIFSCMLTLSSCSSSSISRKQRAVEKRMGNSKSDRNKEIEQLRKEHMDSQSKTSLKMMKKAKKNAIKANRKRQRSNWWQRFLGIEKRHNCRN